MNSKLKEGLFKERRECINKVYAIQQLEKLYKQRKPYKKRGRKMRKLK